MRLSLRFVLPLLLALTAIAYAVLPLVDGLTLRWFQGLRALLRGKVLFRPSDRPVVAELRPIAGDLRTLIRDLEADHRSRDADQMAWTPETLRTIVHDDLRGHQVIVVSNREPYIHVRRGEAIEVRRPASGLVTALANEGLWPLCHIAHVHPVFRTADWQRCSPG